jgi:hypothetical protein
MAAAAAVVNVDAVVRVVTIHARGKMGLLDVRKYESHESRDSIDCTVPTCVAR